MSNRAIGSLLLIASAVCCTLSVAGTQLVYAVEWAASRVSTVGGMAPPEPPAAEIAWPPAVAVILVGMLGIVFLFRKD